jgi:4-hydroxy-tetrahydrodipicolinate synthase
MAQIRTLINTVPPGFMVISGDDSNALDTIEAGGIGVISVLGQGVPTPYSKMIRLALEGDHKAARDMHTGFQRGIDLIFREGNPAGIKAVFEILGLSSARVRLPLVEASVDLKKEIAGFVKPFANITA